METISLKDYFSTIGKKGGQKTLKNKGKPHFVELANKRWRKWRKDKKGKTIS